MNPEQLAAQLYTVRDFCQTGEALARSIRRLRAIGYGAVQLSGVGPIPEEEIVAIMRGEGMTICATHEPPGTILDEPERVIDRLQRLGCARTAFPFPKDIDLGDPAAVGRMIQKLDTAGARLRAASCVLGYHNHAIEFTRFGDATVLDQIYERTDPRHVVAELDTYWVHRGGGDVVGWCRRLRGRLPFIHLKDYRSEDGAEPSWCEVGSGALPFAAIIAEAKASGCDSFIVEQDSCPGDPFESLRQSFEYLAALTIPGEN